MKTHAHVKTMIYNLYNFGTSSAFLTRQIQVTNTIVDKKFKNSNTENGFSLSLSIFPSYTLGRVNLLGAKQVDVIRPLAEFNGSF